MIKASLPRSPDLARRLLAKAERLARAKGQSALLAARGDPSRWRRADLLWPLYPRIDR